MINCLVNKRKSVLLLKEDDRNWLIQGGRHDIQHYNTQHNDIQDNNKTRDTQHNVILQNDRMSFMLSVVMLSVVMLSVVMLSVIMLNVANKLLSCVSLCIMPQGGLPYYHLYYKQITIIVMTFYNRNLQLKTNYYSCNSVCTCTFTFTRSHLIFLQL